MSPWLVPATHLVPPFAQVETWSKADGSVQVRACLQVDRALEGAKTALALDGSASMRPEYGFRSGLLGALGSRKRVGPNRVEIEARKLATHLAQAVDVDRTTEVLYWGTGRASDRVEVVGIFTPVQSASQGFGGPGEFGGGATSLLPAVRHCADRFSAARWGLAVFITDGIVRDLQAVIDYSRQLIEEVSQGIRSPQRFALIGLGAGVDLAQLTELVSFPEATTLWRLGQVETLSSLATVSMALLDETVLVADQGEVRDERGSLVRDYRDGGLPALLEFVLPAGSAGAFVLHTGNTSFRQTLRP